MTDVSLLPQPVPFKVWMCPHEGHGEVTPEDFQRRGDKGNIYGIYRCKGGHEWARRWSFDPFEDGPWEDLK